MKSLMNIQRELSKSCGSGQETQIQWQVKSANVGKVQRETMEINGGDDVDEDFPAEPQPSQQDVLKATSTQ